MKYVAIFVMFLFWGLSTVALDREVCFECHGSADILSMTEEERLEMVVPSEGAEEWPQGLSTLHVDPDRFSRSVHGDFDCLDCHSDISEVPHPQRLGRVDCGMCHEEVAEGYEESGHPALCYQCHNPHYARPFMKVRAGERSSVCLTCHDAGELSEEGYIHSKHIHTGKISCTVCHTLDSESRLVLRLGPEEVAKAVKGKEAIDLNGDGFVDFSELRGLLQGLREAGFKPTLEAEVSVSEPSHKFGINEKWEDCLRCHSPKGLLQRNPILVSPSRRGTVLLETEPKVVTSLSDFYPVGSDRFSYDDLRELFSQREEGKFNEVVSRIGWKWLDILGYIFVIGALAFVALHGGLRLLTLKWRRRHHGRGG
ncbi:MAG: hypothetical protein DRG31_00395 [Deltaproteobacteria bacterium]|nr:MAG: hypothetical protein DRG31_00395 [Deltaproteobacteria bacterium]